MKRFLRCLNKDRIEFMRGRKNLLCLAVVFSCGCMVLLTTMSLPFLLQKLSETGTIFSADTSLKEFMAKFFPDDLKSSIGMFSSDIGVFYSLVVIFLTYNLLPDEVATGKVILPLCAGYNKKQLFISKQIIYCVLCGFPVFAGYMVYYFVGSSLLVNNFTLKSAMVNAASLTCAIALISAFTISLSVIFRRKFMSLIIMASIVIAVPDVLYYFNFAQYFPTFLLTYTYNSLEKPELLIWPLICSLVMLTVLNMVAMSVDIMRIVDDRR